MNMMKMARRLPVLLAILGMVAVTVVPARAANEVSGVKLEPTVMSDQFVKLTDDLVVSWTAPSGSVQVMNYLLKINTSSAALSDTEFKDETGKYDYRVDAAVTSQIILKSVFDSYDSNQLRYLHVKTLYVPGLYSSDVVVGPIRIDNVAPTGSISLDPTSGSSTQITITLSASTDTKYYWLSNTSTMPADSAKQDYTVSNQATGTFFPAYPDTSYGKVKIYAWFKDFAGNVSTAPAASAEYTYTAPVSIQHNASSLNVDATLGFTVDGTTTYDWTITDASVSGVAEFSGAFTGVASVTVIGKKVGTFTVTATPASGTALKTGTITVVQTSTTKQYSLLTGLNIISLSRTGTGWAKAADLASAVGSTCQSIIKWDASKQGFVAHIKGTPLNNFDLVAGDGYFVNVTGPFTLSVTGETVTRTFSLVSGLNLVGMPDAKSALTKAADLASNVGSTCLSLTQWDASKQGFVAHIKGTPLNNYNVSVGDGYFINVNADTQW